MAETREQIYPKVAVSTKAILLRYCDEKHSTQGDVVDAALRAFLQPKVDDDLSRVQMDALRAVEQHQHGLELTFRTPFRTFEAILAGPPAETGGGAIYRLFDALQLIAATSFSP